jgi:phosphoribosylformylglycinamidine cyclo-ligase
MDLSARPPELGGKTLGEALLVPTRLYARQVAAVQSAVVVRAMCHVTGGGLPGNLPRVLPEGLGVRVSCEWDVPPIFDLIAQAGDVATAEMRRTFNLGIGYVFLVREEDAEATLGCLSALGERPVTLGRVVAMPESTPFEERVAWA